MKREIKFEYGFQSVNGIVKKQYYLHEIPYIQKKCDVFNDLPIVYVRQFTGLKDKNGKEIYSDDLLINDKGIVFRIYSTIGGFVFKAPYWMNDLSDLNHYDTLITESLSDAQNISYITTLCAIYSNIHEYKQLKK